MRIVVHPADLEADREVIVETLRRYLTPRASARRYDWLYRDNPHGRARAWIARDTTNETLVGVAAAFPRRVILSGVPHLAWVLGDFCVSERYRSLGPALQLQRALLVAAAEEQGLAGWYDFPSQNMAAVYKRLGVLEQASLIRMAQPLRVDRALALALGNTQLARWMAPIGNLWLALGVQLKGAGASVSIEAHIGKFGDEFTRLACEASPSYDACIERSAEYLNWRFAENPLERYECLVAREFGRLTGYALFTHTAEDAILVDLFGLKQESILGGLLRGLAKVLQKRRVETISAPIVEGHPWRNVLLQAGYRVREASPFVVCPGPSSPAPMFKAPQGSWYLMHGDRDS